LISLITTPTPNLKASIDFYHKAGFKTVPDDDRVLVTDGKVLIEIDPSRYARAGVKLFSNDWKSNLENIENLAVVSSMDNGFLVSDPSGVWIYLVEGEFNPAFEVQEHSFGVFGNCAGMSLESADIARSLKVWKALGFNQVQGSLDNSWISCVNADGLGVSLMRPHTCPHLFFNPSLTYFNSGLNLEVIVEVNRLGIPITEEITFFNEEGVVDNIVVRDPGGYGFFIFND